jgi:hypothetical protein
MGAEAEVMVRVARSSTVAERRRAEEEEEGEEV